MLVKQASRRKMDKVRRAELEIVKRPDEPKGFVLVARHWINMGIFPWIN
jgi:hypothetical protein